MQYTARLVTSGQAENVVILQSKHPPPFAPGEYIIKAGLLQARADVVFRNSTKTPNTLVFSKQLAEALSLPGESKIKFKVTAGCLEIGPFIGVFISERKVERLLSGDRDSVYWRFQQWADALHGIIFFFALSGVNWQSGRVTAYRWNEKGEWTAGQYPFPLAIYDRCFGQDGRAAAARLRAGISEAEWPVTVYNAVIKLGKYEVYEHLRQFAAFTGILPQFAWYDREQLLAWLETGSQIYLKPDRLYKGRGIMRACRTSDGYVLEIRGEEDNEKFVFSDALSFLSRVEELMETSQHYLMQAGINLATFLGNRFDIRVMLQKTMPDRWQATAANARIAPVDSVITSPRSGGKVIRITAALQHAFPGREEELLGKITALCEALGNAMEEKFGFLGELGVDLGLDTEGNLRLIEVNGKPLKVSFTRLRDRGINRSINLAPVLLGTAVAGFASAPQCHYRLGGREDIYCLRLLPYGPGWPICRLSCSMELLQRLGCRFGERVTLQIGSERVQAEITAHNGPESGAATIYLSSQLCRKFFSFLRQPLALLAHRKGHLVFAPLVGMTVSDSTVRRLAEDYELKRTAELAAEKGVLFYVFTPDAIDWEQDKVAGYTYNLCTKQWEEKRLPAPQVLYDMATYPYNPEKRRVAREANRLLRESWRRQVINHKRYFGKWQTYQALAFFSGLRHHVPETAELTAETLALFLDKYPFCYLKGNYGSYGAEVVRVEKTKAGYGCRAGGWQIKEWSFADLASLYNFACSYLGTNTIVQQGINLATINGRIFDLRILVQKDYSGSWQVPVISFRIARPGAVITNVMSGADEILVGPRDPLPYQGVSWASLVAFARNVSLALEACFGLHGEIGLDIGIDNQGWLWVIEANSKPNTSGYEQLAPEEVCSAVYSLPLEYAKFLAQRMYALQPY